MTIKPEDCGINADENFEWDDFFVAVSKRQWYRQLASFPKSSPKLLNQPGSIQSKRIMPQWIDRPSTVGRCFGQRGRFALIKKIGAAGGVEQ